MSLLYRLSSATSTCYKLSVLYIPKRRLNGNATAMEKAQKAAGQIMGKSANGYAQEDVADLGGRV